MTTRRPDPDWGDFMDAYSRSLRRIERETFRASTGVRVAPTLQEQIEADHDEATFLDFIRAHPESTIACEMVSDLQGRQENLSKIRR